MNNNHFSVQSCVELACYSTKQYQRHELLFIILSFVKMTHRRLHKSFSVNTTRHIIEEGNRWSFRWSHYQHTQQCDYLSLSLHMSHLLAVILFHRVRSSINLWLTISPTQLWTQTACVLNCLSICPSGRDSTGAMIPLRRPLISLLGLL